MTNNHASVVDPTLRIEPYSTKRHGLSLASCDSEPVQTPGCVQMHGALLVLRLFDLRILQVSENALEVLGHTPEKLLGEPTSKVLGNDGMARLRNLLDTQHTDCSVMYLLTLPAVRNSFGTANNTTELDVTFHTIDGVAVLEFEPTRRTDVVDLDYFALVRRTVARLQNSRSLQQFCHSAAEEIRELTGMDRVMVYKFHADHHGEVYAESKAAGLDSWVGWHYPAEDIPKPAREVFGKTWIRPIPSMSTRLAELVPLVNPDTGKPLEMTYCALRGVSLMCTEYFLNMGVAATLTLSIRRNDKLWGLIACHHYAGPKHTNYQVRAACEFLAQVVSLQHQAAEDKEHLAYRLKLEGVHGNLVALAGEGGGLAALTSNTPSLLAGIDATGAALFHMDRWWLEGATPSEEKLNGLAEWLTADKFLADRQTLYATDSLASHYPPAASFTNVASGLLAMPISLSGRSILMWFRPEIIQTVNWGGDPKHKLTVMGPNGPRLSPRGSFDLFVESVKCRSFPWLEVETIAAGALRHLLLEMVVERNARMAHLTADLARSNEELDTFAYVTSHDLKEPLRGISQYTSQLLEDCDELNAESHKKLARIRQLSLRMESLLEALLHYSRSGRADLVVEEVNLNDVLDEAIQMVNGRQSSINVTLNKVLPTVHCQRVWVREVFVNLLANAITFNNQSIKRIEVGYIQPTDKHLRPGCPENLKKQDIFYVADNGIGIDAKHFDQAFKLFRRLHGREDYGGGGGTGLTIVRKLVERHGGKVWLSSEIDVGTTVYFTLPGEVAEQA